MSANTLTLHQPYASLIVAGVKTIETRPRRMNYRGRLFVHAAKREPVEKWHNGFQASISTKVTYDGQHHPWCLKFGETEIELPLPLGAVVGHVDVVDCLPIVQSMSDEDLNWVADGKVGGRLLDPGPVMISVSGRAMFGLRIVHTWTDESMYRYVVTSNDLHAPDAEHHFDYRVFPPDWASLFDAVVFDPPYVVRGGRDTDSSFREMNDAYGIHAAPTSPDELAEMNHAGLTECARVCRQGGILFVKYADAVSSGRRIWQIDGMKRHAEAIGLTLIDRLVFYTKAPRKQPERTRKDGTESVQQHAHNNTSELLVFRTPGKPSDRTISMF